VRDGRTLGNVIAIIDIGGSTSATLRDKGQTPEPMRHAIAIHHIATLHHSDV